MFTRYITIIVMLLVLISGAGCAVTPSTQTPALPSVTPAPTTTPLPSTATSAPPATAPVSKAAPTAAATSLLPLSGSGGGVIAFTSARDGNSEIYVMNADGSDPRRLTNQRGEDYWPTWSPDGTQIAFASERDGNFEIYVMNADGSNQRRLTHNNANDLEPAWSPAPPGGGTGGTQIAFMYYSADKGAIYVMDVDGNNRWQLTDGSGDDWLPAWSPAPPGGGTGGAQIVFVSRRDGNPEIYIMDADGSHQRRLTNNMGEDTYPAWSPAPPGSGTGGAQISFFSEREGSRDLYLMNADGSNVRQLTHDNASVWVSAWSPDGTQIAFTSERDGNREIYVIDADGANLRRLTNNRVSDDIPAWRPSPSTLSQATPPASETPAIAVPPTAAPASPTATPTGSHPLSGSGGGRIVFASKRDENYEIYVMNADGTDQRRLTNTPHEEGRPAWSPDCSQIAFESDRSGHFDLYVMNADGSNVRRLTTKGEDGYPAWSPAPPGGGTGGARIAFSRYDPGSDIYVINADGANLLRLTQTGVGGVDMDIFDPDWSPAPPGGGTGGTQIVCVVDADPDPMVEESSIYVLDVLEVLRDEGDGSDALRPLPRPGRMNDNPNWSPNGSQIAFDAEVNNRWGIYVVNADGTGLQRLTQTQDYDEFAPAWSPAPPSGGTGGTQIAFQSNPDGQWDIYIMNADGTGRQRLTSDPANDIDPDWCP